MELTHDFSVPAGPDETWAAFNHLELIASCLPGCLLSSVAGHDFVGTLRLKLGPSTLAYLGTGRFVERHVGGRRTVITASGTDERGKGTADVTLTTSFAESGDQTAVHIATELTLTGPPAQLADGVVREAADRLVGQFAEAIRDRFAAGLGAEALALDANPGLTGPLGQSASSRSKTYAFSPPAAASQTDFDVFVRVAPIWAKRVVPALLGGVTMLWLARRRRRPNRLSRR